MNGLPRVNNSNVLIGEIGDRTGGGVGEALLCYTDSTQCCTVNTGRWFKLGGDDVGDANSGTGDFYISRGASVISLHRRNGTSSTGMYCCEVPDAQSQNIRACANISELIFINSKCLS